MLEVTSLLKKLLEKQNLLEKREPENNEEQAYQNHRERNEAATQGQRRYRNRNGRGQGRGTPSGYNRARDRGQGCFECGAFDHYIAACPHLPGRQRSINGDQCPGNDNRPVATVEPRKGRRKPHGLRFSKRIRNRQIWAHNNCDWICARTTLELCCRHRSNRYGTQCR